MIPVHKKKELIAFIEKLEDENVLEQIQALLIKAKTDALASATLSTDQTKPQLPKE
ncbi:hypothetical protein MUN82_15345 [Hymenobacter aerilatus]|uniref:Uncharacterized protein n=1 Tax=Hymenobacter aerilatus TaxID=2932251 RepID=A0A8T9SVN1_9BACT|nr:hypothetical protein [Hymenobacter aerilatus]UOR04310.1 hypothetical protein MUN82_15345 [Hymenobacter aerilatus]